MGISTEQLNMLFFFFLLSCAIQHSVSFAHFEQQTNEKKRKNVSHVDIRHPMRNCLPS